LFPLPYPPGKIIFFLAAKLGAVPACILIPEAVNGYMAAAGERPGIMKGPDQGPVDEGEVFNADESITNPVKMNNIRVHRVDLSYDPGRQCLDMKRGIFLVAIDF
jgi:hypothetical protein